MNDVFLFDKLELRNSNKKYFARAIAFLKGNEIDYKDSIITDEAKAKMAERMKELDIVVDVEHDSVASNRPNLLPAAKARSVEWEGDKAIVEIELNEHSPQFKSTWGSLKNKFLDAVSVAFKPLKWHTEVIDGRPMKVFTDVLIDSLGFTGRTATKGTNIFEVFTRSVNEMENEKKLEEKSTEPVNTETVVEQKEEVKVEKTVEVTPSVTPEVKETGDKMSELLKAKEENAVLREELAAIKAKEEVIAAIPVQEKSIVGEQKPPYSPEEVKKEINDQLDDLSMAELLKLKQEKK